MNTAPMRAIALGARQPSGPARELAIIQAKLATRPAAALVRPAVATAPVRAEPSWRHVLATTIKLWSLRRLRLGGFGPPASARGRNRNEFRWPAGDSRYGPVSLLARWRWRLTAVVMSLAVGAGAVLLITASSPPATRVRPADAARALPAGRAGPGGASSRPAAQSQAAAWIASQVGGLPIIACDPAMCAALQAAGVVAGRLMPLPPGVMDPPGAGLLVTAAPVSRPLADEYAPALIASFGSGGTRIEVRAIEPGGAAAYQAALRVDLAARQSAGSELLRNSRLTFTAQEASRLRAGEVDARVLATLAALASQHSFRVTSFGDASPGVQLPYRGVTIASRGEDVAAALAMVRAQPTPYLPAHSAIVTPAGGAQGASAALSIEFAAPSPLGLLTAVLTVAHSARPA